MHPSHPLSILIPLFLFLSLTAVLATSSTPTVPTNETPSNNVSCLRLNPGPVPLSNPPLQLPPQTLTVPLNLSLPNSLNTLNLEVLTPFGPFLIPVYTYQALSLAIDEVRAKPPDLAMGLEYRFIAETRYFVYATDVLHGGSIVFGTLAWALTELREYQQEYLRWRECTWEVSSGLGVIMIGAVGKLPGEER